MPACAAGFVLQTVFSSDFEGGAAGFTHSGTGDQWALGLPNTPGTSTANPVAAFTTCNSGVSCWKTNLTGTYNLSTVHDLLSPNINLAGLSAPVVVTWAQRYQMETATNDHLFVDYQQAGGATPVRLFEWLDATMTDLLGNPAVYLPASAGWGVFARRADSLAGLNTELRFHVDADNSVSFAGLAVDDVSVTACRALSADLAITKSDGVTTAMPGGSVTYTITASNGGVDPVAGASVADTFPASLTCNWTCVGAGGGTCTAAGSGSIGDTANLPVGGSVTYTASCTISAAAIGTLTNTATVSSAAVDPVPGNNSATDTTDILSPATVSGTKSAAGTFAVGSTVTYTVVLTNSGAGAQLDNPGDEFTDVLPASLTLVSATATSGTAVPTIGTNTVTWNGSIPAAGSVTITITATVNAGTLGQTISNQGTISYDSDGNGTNESTASTDDPDVGGAADPTVFVVTGSVLEIPTLSGLGFIALALVLAGLALARLRRRTV